MQTLTITEHAEKQWLACPECLRPLGQVAGDVFGLSVHPRSKEPRIVIGPPPALVFCEICGGVWRNPAWDIPESPQVIWQRFRTLPCPEYPQRDWSAVPSDKRPLRYR